MVTRSSPKVIKLPVSLNEKKIITATTAKRSQIKDADYYIRDVNLKGFYIRVRKSGNKTYGIESKLSSTKEKINISIGDINLFTEKQARARATELLIKIKDNIDPRAEKNISDGGKLNLKELLEEYIVSRNTQLGNKTISDYRYYFLTYGGKVTSKPINRLKKDDFINWYKGMSEKLVAAQRTFSVMRAVLRYAVAQEYIKDNPGDKAKVILGKLKSNPPRRNSIPLNKIGDFANALLDTDISPTMRDFVLFLVLTGLRRTEASNITWDDIDFTNNTINIEKTKSGRALIFPMTSTIEDMLRWRKRNMRTYAGLSSDFVFPSNTSSKSISDPKRALDKISKEAKLGFKLRCHDLRRTFATLCNELGISLEESGKLLNHASRNVTDNYIQRSLEFQKKQFEKVRDLIESKISITVNGAMCEGVGNAFSVWLYEGKEDNLNIELEPKIESEQFTSFELEPGFRYVDLFCGIGGFKMALDYHKGRCVLSNDWDKYASQTYRYFFGETETHINDDIDNVIANNLVPEHDVLVGGFPCQPFSNAGKRKGFKDEKQGHLFFSIEKIVREKRPKLVILENVRNVFKDEIYSVIENSFKESGYYAARTLINAKYWVPQSRIRAYMLFFNEDFYSRNFVEKFQFYLEQLEVSKGNELPFSLIKEKGVSKEYQIPQGTWDSLNRHKNKHQEKKQGFGFSVVDEAKASRTLSARYHKDGAEILVNEGWERPRKITETEGFNLMGLNKYANKYNFNDGFIFPENLSKAQRYKQLGNSLVPEIIVDILNILKNIK